MDIFVYATPGFGRPLDQVEDAIEDWLGDRGEVTGSGTGQSGSNVDIEVFADPGDVAALVAELRSVLQSLGLPQDSRIVVDRVAFPVYQRVS